MQMAHRQQDQDSMPYDKQPERRAIYVPQYAVLQRNTPPRDGKRHRR